ncbi:MAG: sulfite exporter TauE/SafE family protein, partial [Chloroflexi bacterium]|nr:sulfite exporter TauE/SafE family protein [Chloroflexota bacterium]
MGPLDAALIGSFALLGSIVGAIAGFGTGIIMLPILVFFFGIRESIPTLTVAMLLTNRSRSWFN